MLPLFNACFYFWRIKCILLIISYCYLYNFDCRKSYRVCFALWNCFFNLSKGPGYLSHAHIHHVNTRISQFFLLLLSLRLRGCMCLKNKSYSFNMSALQAAHLGVCCNKHWVDYSMIKSFRTAGAFLFAECKMCWFSWQAQRGLCYSGSFTIKLKLVLVRVTCSYVAICTPRKNSAPLTEF